MCLVTQLCLTLCNPMDYSPPGSTVHELLQARILEWIVFPFSRESSWSRDQIWVSCIAGGFFTVWATKEAHIPIRKIKIKSDNTKNFAVTLENWQFLKRKHTSAYQLTIQPSNDYLSFAPEKWKLTSTHRHEHSYSKQFICSIYKKNGNNKKSLNRWLVKLVYLHHGCYSAVESNKHQKRTTWTNLKSTILCKRS